VPAPRIGILVVAYNAAGTLAGVLDRIPESFRPEITTVLIGDDASSDSTHLVAVGYQQLDTDLPIVAVRHEQNLGYGGNQKWGYRWAIEHDLDVIVLLHGDGQYAPEMLPDMVAPIVAGDADAVFGSRMLDRGAALAGGMPRYKYVGNRILTTVENAAAGVSLSEWHSGYRAYSVHALADLPFERNSDGFDFDTEVIIQLIEGGKRIAEIPIPTYYGDEICHVNGLGYAKDVTVDVLRYRAHKMGFGTGELAFASQDYEEKSDVDSSHVQLLAWAAVHRPRTVLDLGCGDGRLAEQLAELGADVTGVDLHAADGVKDRVHRFVQADLDRGLPEELDGSYDLVVAADVLEHVRHPEQLLGQMGDRIAPGGALLLSVPNFGHWYPRARVLLGRFDYDRRGILDRDHVRFFTRRSLERLLTTGGFRIDRRGTTGLPIEVVDRGAEDAGGSGARRAVAAADRALRMLRPQLFAYQFLYDVRPDPRTPS
jgi:methionine biosynthesis protein MetW